MKQKHLFIAILILISVLLLTSGCIIGPENPSKTVSPENKGPYEYVRDGEKATVTKYTGKDKNIIIPETIDGLLVTAIGEGCFEDTEVVSIYVPETIRQLGDYMCHNVSTLEKLTFANEENITSIGKGIISGTGVEKTITVENPFYSIGGILVRVNPQVSGTVTIPDNIYTMTSGAFENSNAEVIEFPENFQTVFATDLYSMRSLKCVVINGADTVIERSAMFRDNSQYIKTVDNTFVINYAKSYGYFYDVISAKEDWRYTEEDGGIKLTEYKGKSENVRMPSEINGKTVTALGSNAINGTTARLYVPASIKIIEEGFADGKGSLSHVFFEDENAIEFIGAYAFRNTAFELETNRKNDMSVIGGILVRHFGTGEITVDKSVKTVAGKAFGKGIVGVTFSEGVTRFEDGMLLDGEDIEYIVIPNSMTEININAFNERSRIIIRCDAVSAAAQFAVDNSFECEAIYYWEYETDEENKTARLLKYTGGQTDVVIPSSVYDYEVTAVASIMNTTAKTLFVPSTVRTIEDMFAFRLEGLKSVTFEDESTIEYIGARAFFGTAYEKTEQNENNGLHIIGKTLLSCSATGAVTVPEGVEVIAPLAFYESKAENVILPESCREIGSWAFRSCSKLKTVYIKDLVEKIGDNILDDTRNAVVLCHENSYAESFAKLNSYAYENVSYETWEWETVKDGIRLIRYLGSERKLVIPKTVCGINVTELGDGCLDSKNLSSLVVPSTVRRIGDRAFAGNPGLTTVTFEDESTVEDIGDGAFKNTAFFNSISDFDESGSYYINGILVKCKAEGIQELTPETKKIAGNSYVNSKVTYVIVNEACREIGSFAFADVNQQGLKTLEAIYIPDGVTEIGSMILGRESSTVIQCHENSTALQYAVANGYKYKIIKNEYTYEENKAENTARLLRYTGDNKALVSVPRYINGRRVTSIAGGCFADKNVENIYCHNDIRRIEANAFCSSLKNITFEDASTLEEVEENAFANTVFSGENEDEFFMVGGILIRCRSTDEVTIPDYVKRIASGAFDGCTASGINVLNENVILDDYAFRNAACEWVFIAKNVSAIGKDIIQNTKMYIRCEAGSYAEQYAIRNGYRFIVDSEDFDWEYSVESEGIVLTRYKGENEDVVIPARIAGLNVYAIEDNCFDSSTIRSIVIPETVYRLGDEAFANTLRLEEITFVNEANVTDVGSAVFANSAVLESLYGENGFATVNRILIACRNTGAVVLADDIQKIAGRAFAGNGEITSVTVNNICRFIGNGAFADMAKLEWIRMPDSVYEFEGELFTDYGIKIICADGSEAYKYAVNRGIEVSLEERDFIFEAGEHGATIVDYVGKNRNVVIPSRIGEWDVITVGAECFRGKDIESVYIPSTVSELGDLCFAYCVNLKEVRFENESNVTTVGDRTFFETYFENVSGLDENNTLTVNGILLRQFGTGTVEVSGDVKQIVGGAFIDNAFITTVNINEGCKSIEKNAFNRLTGLLRITIPSTVRYIDDKAFVGCNINVVIECKKGSYAEQFAMANGYTYVAK